MGPPNLPGHFFYFLPLVSLFPLFSFLFSFKMVSLCGQDWPRTHKRGPCASASQTLERQAEDTMSISFFFLKTFFKLKIRYIHHEVHDSNHFYMHNPTTLSIFTVFLPPSGSNSKLLCHPKQNLYHQ